MSENNSIQLRGVDIEHIQISFHAFERFQTRYEALKEVQLSFQEATDKLRSLIIEAKPEKEKQALKKLRSSYDGIRKSLVNLPWRFIFSGNTLITSEIVPEIISVVQNPQVPPCQQKAKFFVRIEENQEEFSTTMVKSLDRDFAQCISLSELHLSEMSEVNAVIRSLRAIGIEVNYKRTGTKAQKSAILEAIVPQNLYSYEVFQLVEERKIVIHVGVNELFPLGLKEVMCVGITKSELEEILKFLLDEE